MCDLNYEVCFDASSCKITCPKTKELKLKGNRVGNVYLTLLGSSRMENCLVTNTSQNSWLWHNRLGHASMNLIKKLVKHDLVNGFPKLKFERDYICGTCMKGKQISVSFKPTNEVLTSRPLTLLHDQYILYSYLVSKLSI